MDLLKNADGMIVVQPALECVMHAVGEAQVLLAVRYREQTPQQTIEERQIQLLMDTGQAEALLGGLYTCLKSLKGPQESDETTH